MRLAEGSEMRRRMKLVTISNSNAIAAISGFLCSIAVLIPAIEAKWEQVTHVTKIRMVGSIILYMSFTMPTGLFRILQIRAVEEDNSSTLKFRESLRYIGDPAINAGLISGCTQIARIVHVASEVVGLSRQRTTLKIAVHHP